MDALRTIEPRRVRELLRRPSSTLILPFAAFEDSDRSNAYAWVVPPDGGSAGNASDASDAGNAGGGNARVAERVAGLRIPGGDAGLARVIGDALAGHGVYGEPEAAGYRVGVPAEVLAWIADPVLLWRLLAGVYGSGQVEVSLVSSEELSGALSSPSETVWHCRTGDVGWVVLDGGERDKQDLARVLQRIRDFLRAIGLQGAAVTMERRPPSVVSGGTKLVRMAAADRVAYWPVSALNRLLKTIVAAGGSINGSDTGNGTGSDAIEDGNGAAPSGPVALQRMAAVRVCDQITRSGGIGALVGSLPRSAAERRGRYAVRTVMELIKAGGTAPRVLAETAYRSGEHYRSMALVLGGLAASDRELVRRALGRRRWEQLVMHSERKGPAPLPWNAFAGAADVVVKDLAERSRRPGSSPPAAVTAIVRRFYTDPRESRLQDTWRRQIENGFLARPLEEARLTLLRPLIRRLPWDVLVRAGCGDTREVRMRISAAFSRRGRQMYLEDVEVLDRKVTRREVQEWDQFLAARMAVRAAAVRAATPPTAGGMTKKRVRPSGDPRHRVR